MVIDPYSDGTARADLCKEIQIVMNEKKVIRGGSTGWRVIQKYWIKRNWDKIEWGNWIVSTKQRCKK